jgi:hypothetical protein
VLKCLTELIKLKNSTNLKEKKPSKSPPKALLMESKMDLLLSLWKTQQLDKLLTLIIAALMPPDTPEQNCMENLSILLYLLSLMSTMMIYLRPT